MKKKILILINSDIYVRNYIETEVFKKIIKNFDCHFIACSNEVSNKKVLKKKLNFLFKGFINYTQKDFIKFQKSLYKNFQLNKEKSKTISYLTKIKLKSQFYHSGDNYHEIIYKFPFRFISWLKKNIEFAVNRICNNNNIVRSSNKDIVSIYKKIKPDLIIFPFQDAHIASFDLLQISKNVKSLGLIDNWDNLSSRATHQINPKYISVWGEQTKQHAIKFQKYNKNNIFILGTPRFEKYFKKRNIKLGSYFKSKYILFLESFNNYNNVSLLKKLDELILNNKKFKGYKIVYRPHPWQKDNKETISEKNFRNIIIDPQLKKNYQSRYFSTSFQPNIEYYSSLIKNAELVITGPTSMLIEASIFHKKILLLGHKSKSSTPHSEELENFEHLQGIKKLSNIKILREESKFINNLLDIHKIKIDKSKIDKIRNFYLDYSGKKYSDMLFDITKKILHE